MPGANEVHGCPQVKTSFKKFFRMPPLSWMPGAITFFPLIFKHLPLFLYIYLHFFSENFLVGCPPAGCPGRRTPHTPSARHWLCIETDTLSITTYMKVIELTQRFFKSLDLIIAASVSQDVSITVNLILTLQSSVI